MYMYKRMYMYVYTDIKIRWREGIGLNRCRITWHPKDTAGPPACLAADAARGCRRGCHGEGSALQLQLFTVGLALFVLCTLLLVCVRVCFVSVCLLLALVGLG